ncbi:hypothetical protein DMB38_31180 [Streptomyces sp. WAC 06738]|uniref:hypothetical protein n=1 Tax=Streptomyces sp. WAC 06738 TaxID=2203210 RepID=UPI000F6EEEF8|nr:hypothetical protein [Streptomyces sp. WAC 06738]AZM49647.1 hypothetical protein DMB38_31180 [Streptomyces sp. WAC 06738]
MAVIGATTADGHGVFDVEVPVPGARSDSATTASVSEFSHEYGPALGIAGLEVLSVVPAQDVVKVKINVKWDSSLRVRVCAAAF